jgi:hypothetical protein
MSYEHPTHEELVREALLRMMSDLSEDCWCAGWLQNLEFTLWEAMNSGNKELGWGGVAERDFARMKHLHEMAGGWWVWAEGENRQRFVTTEEWLTIIDKKNETGTQNQP